MVVRRPSSSIRLPLLLAGVVLILAALAPDVYVDDADAVNANIAASASAAPPATATANPTEHRIIKRRAESSAAKATDRTPATPLATDAPSLWRPLLSLVAVLLVIAAAAWLFRRFSGGSKQFRVPAGIEIVARSVLNPKQSLCLVKLGSRLVLLGVSPNHIAPLQTIDQPDEVAGLLGLLESQSPGSISSVFGKLFHHQSGKYDQSADLWPDSDDSSGNDQSAELNNAKGELANLLQKVKGLTRLGARP